MFTGESLQVALEVWGTVFCVIATICLAFTRKRSKNENIHMMYIQIATGMLLLSDAFAFLYRGGESRAAYVAVRVCNFFVYFFTILIVVFYHLYVCEKLQIKRDSVRMWIGYGVCAVAEILVIVSQFTHLYYRFDEHNRYHRTSCYPLHAILMYTAVVITGSLLIEYRKRINSGQFLAMLSYIVLPFIASIVQTIHYGVALGNFAVSIATIAMFISAMVEQSRQLTQAERDVYDMRSKMLLSQIQPHFIYNTLTTIKYLCRKNPDEAADTIDDFSQYLRMNLETLGEKKLRHLEWELEHVKNYMAIEKRRFGDRIEIGYHIDDGGFKLPALTLQPIVENAVKHGIRKREDGGRIDIYAFRDADYHIIRIVDNGVGFDMTKEHEPDGVEHVGIKNVRMRLLYMCQGSLTIISKPDVGTTVEIRIPV